MLDVFLDALIDSLKTLPFLFAAYFLIEYLEHRASSKMERGLQKLGKFGPIGGASGYGNRQTGCTELHRLGCVCCRLCIFLPVPIGRIQ